MTVDQAPFISIVIPCYNCEAFIGRAIESVFSQNFKNWELILVNNNSTDGTQQVLLEYQQLHPDKIKVLQELKKGAPAARNKGLAEAKGEWIQYLDADDELLPDKIANQLYIIKSGDVDFIAGDATLITLFNGEERYSKKGIYVEDYWIALAKSQLGITSANLYRKYSLLAIGGWHEELKSSQEYDLTFRLLKKGFDKVGFDTSCNTKIYKSNSSISYNQDIDVTKDIIERRIVLREDIKAYLRSNGLLSNTRLQAIDEYIYNELFRNRKQLPEYVSVRLQRLGMSIPYVVRIKDCLADMRQLLKKIAFSR